jgi:hypothetical protein
LAEEEVEAITQYHQQLKELKEKKQRDEERTRQVSESAHRNVIAAHKLRERNNNTVASSGARIMNSKDYEDSVGEL